jgi:hypothetical protein
MAEDKKKADAWQTITLLIVVLALFGGLYVSNQAIDSRLNSVEQSITGNAEMLKMVIERVEDKIVALDKAPVGAAPAVAAGAPEPGDKEADADKGEKEKK